MRKSLQLLSMIFAFALVITGARISGILPVDTQTYIEKKYAGWNGVLQAWICTNWNPGGSFTRWLNDQASAFERRHNGVFIEFIPVNQETMRKMDSSGVRRPDIVLFSPGVLNDSSNLMPLNLPDHIRTELLNANRRAIPLAMGGYIWACNSSLCEAPPTDPEKIQSLVIPSDETGRLFSAALAGLLSGDIPSDEIQLPEADLDLGLPAASVAGLIQSNDAVHRFINGEIACVPVSQKEISRLIQLRENGRGPDWFLFPSGDFCFTDQLLLGGIPFSSDGDAEERRELCHSFLLELTGEEAQAKLSDIGAFSINGKRIYSNFSAYAPLDALLCSRSLWVPDAFSEYSAPNSAAIVRSLLDGKVCAKDALRQMGFEGM